MTAKRFILSDFFWEVLDTKYDWLGNTEPFSEEVIEEEDYLLIGRARTQDDGEDICKLLNKMVEENEQLKSSDTITDLETEIMKLKTIIDQLRTDNTKQKKKLNTAMKENEYIKQTIKDMIESERTEIGKMTLRHLWRQIQ